MQSKYDGEGLLQLYNNVNKEIKNMIDQMKQAKSVVNKLNNKDYWAGSGFDVYEKKFNALSSNFGAFCNDLYVLNNNIKSSIERYKAVDAAVKSML